MNLATLVETLRGGLIVSCQALPDEPLYGSEHMAAMARSAIAGGAAGIRANSPADIRAIRQVVQVPIIGLFKVDLPGFDVRITPTIAHAMQVAQAGADIIAIDATGRSHPEGLSVMELINRIRTQTGKPVLADVANVTEGNSAAQAGADFIAGTLSGYSINSPVQQEPDFDLLEELVSIMKSKGIPVIAEGRIASPEQAAKALGLGAHAVVVGSAITRPQWITAGFVKAMQESAAG